MGREYSLLDDKRSDEDTGNTKDVKQQVPLLGLLDVRTRNDLSNDRRRENTVGESDKVVEEPSVSGHFSATPCRSATPGHSPSTRCTQQCLPVSFKYETIHANGHALLEGITAIELWVFHLEAEVEHRERDPGIRLCPTSPPALPVPEEILRVYSQDTDAKQNTPGVIEDMHVVLASVAFKVASTDDDEEKDDDDRVTESKHEAGISLWPFQLKMWHGIELTW